LHTLHTDNKRRKTMNIWQRLWHAHTYEIIKRSERTYEQTRDGEIVKRDFYLYLVNRCTGCGKIKNTESLI